MVLHVFKIIMLITTYHLSDDLIFSNFVLIKLKQSMQTKHTPGPNTADLYKKNLISAEDITESARGEYNNIS